MKSITMTHEEAVAFFADKGEGSPLDSGRFNLHLEECTECMARIKEAAQAGSRESQAQEAETPPPAGLDFHGSGITFPTLDDEDE